MQKQEKGVWHEIEVALRCSWMSHYFSNGHQENLDVSVGKGTVADQAEQN